jgi:hypothetical protein
MASPALLAHVLTEQSATAAASHTFLQQHHLLCWPVLCQPFSRTLFLMAPHEQHAVSRHNSAV